MKISGLNQSVFSKTSQRLVLLLVDCLLVKGKSLCLLCSISWPQSFQLKNHIILWELVRLKTSSKQLLDEWICLIVCSQLVLVVMEKSLLQMVTSRWTEVVSLVLWTKSQLLLVLKPLSVGIIPLVICVI